MMLQGGVFRSCSLRANALCCHQDRVDVLITSAFSRRCPHTQSMYTGSTYANEHCKAIGTLTLEPRLAQIRETVENVKAAKSVLVIGGGHVCTFYFICSF
jgi:hypothetical protein